MSPLLLLLVLVASDTDPGVMFDPGRDGFRESARVIQADGAVEEIQPTEQFFGRYVAAELPESDRAKINLVVYYDSTDPESIMLLRDFDQHPGLRVLKDWCKWVPVDRMKSPAAEARAIAAAAQDARVQIPYVTVYSHPDHPVFGKSGPGGWESMYYSSGYGGDAGKLARDIYDGIVGAYRKHGAEQCPGPYCPAPTPDSTPYQPHFPRPVEPRIPRPDWPITPLPEMPDGGPEPGLRDGLSRDTKVLLLGAAAVFALWLAWRLKLVRFGAGCLLLAMVVGCHDCCLADEPQEDPAVELETPPDAVEQAYLYPPVPPDWEWLEGVVRDQVRRAAPTEGLLMDSFIEVRQEVDAAKTWAYVMVGLNVVTLILVAAIFRKLQKEKP